ncbi:MAG: tat pathway signal sequence domain protein [Phaeodactylibacter sp.]|nr:tat pathway signal sequence domain protein [Phaeodactylibacter sp.]MCB9277125.1 YHS domain protein [Lewinellaceae bacterium]
MKDPVLAFLLMFLAISAAGQERSGAAVFSTRAGAIDGYDPVAYFTRHQPVKGLPGITFEWEGAIWHFASKDNRELFAEKPERYAPQYGGWCAYGWAQGYPAKIDPEAWSIVDGKLYLNYSTGIRKKWEKKQAEYIDAAGKNYSAAVH